MSIGQDNESTASVAQDVPRRQFTFSNFVRDESNELAHSAALKATYAPSQEFSGCNPVMLHCSGDWGKTHLLRAACAALRVMKPTAQVLFLDARELVALSSNQASLNTIETLLEEVRSADLVAIDDIHVLDTRIERIHSILLMRIIDQGIRVILSSNSPPSAIEDIDPRLRSYLSQGLVCGIEMPQRSLRIAILRKKFESICQDRGLSPNCLDTGILEFLADNYLSSVREMEGGLNILIAAVSNLRKMSLFEAKGVLGVHLGGGRRITVKDIKKAIGAYYHIPQDVLISELRCRDVARPRQVGMWLCRKLTTRSLPDIGRRFGGRDHTTVLHAIRRIEKLMLSDKTIAADIENIRKTL